MRGDKLALILLLSACIVLPMSYWVGTKGLVTSLLLSASLWAWLTRPGLFFDRLAARRRWLQQRDAEAPNRKLK